MVMVVSLQGLLCLVFVCLGPVIVPLIIISNTSIKLAPNYVGVVPSEARQMVHGLHRKHLVKVLEHDFPSHYLEILTKILNLCRQEVLIGI